MGKHSRLSNIFKLMKQRCYDANRKDFCNYGARGITVCDECHKKHCKEVKKVRDRAIWEAIFFADCNREVSTQFKESE